MGDWKVTGTDGNPIPGPTTYHLKDSKTGEKATATATSRQVLGTKIQKGDVKKK